MLEYENQMLLDLLHEDGLLVAAKGLGLERILTSLIITYNDPGNLVLVIGTTSREEEYVLSQLEGQGVTPIPRCVTAECPVNERSQIYANGGVLFVTSRILVMDILMERVPVDLVTGVIVWKAHKILESCQEAFILRLFRMKNKTGFVKGLSSSPLSFTAGFCHVERVMRNLFVKKLYLWPRFHMDVNACLEKCKPEVIELHLKMTTPVQQIQMAVLDLITETVQELRRSNSTIDTEEFTPENAISKSFEKILKVQLEPIWHQLSSRTKMLIADLKVMRTVLMYLTQYDCVTFYNLVNSLGKREAFRARGGIFFGGSRTFFLNSKLGFGSAASPTKKSVREDNAKKLKREYIDQNLEVNPKWLALSEVLAEIREEVQEGKNLEKCLVVTHDDRTSQQLKEYLIDGAQVVLRRIFYRTIGAKMGLQPPPSLFRDKDKNMPKEKGKKGKKTKTTEGAKEEVTLTQITKKYEFVGQDKSEFTNEAETSEEVEEIRRRFLSPLIMVQSVRVRKPLFTVFHLFCYIFSVATISFNLFFSLTQKFNQEVKHSVLSIFFKAFSSFKFFSCVTGCFLIFLQVWQANHTERIRVYFLLYKGTTEEQVYLTNIKREKDAFEYLINEKATMVIPEYNDGKSGDHPDLSRDPRKANEIDTSGNSNSRKGGQTGEEPKVPQRIIVDMREFRSELPALIHKRGIDIDPVTIEVGDYILTPDVCVERKSLSDLIGSLNSGRLYNQAQAMTRYYKKPVLLIEFDQNKSFHLQGRFFLSSDASSSAKDVAAKLQLLTLHFPHLRLLWCPSPYATAEIFQLLKEGKEEPVVAQAQAITAETNPEVDSDKFNPQIKDFISKLPGITTKNIYSVLNKVSDLSELLSLSKEKLKKILGNSRNAQALYSGLHHCMKPPEKEDLKKGSKFTKKGLKRFRTKM
ncbi:LOW QUALITY PROTEIN: DNA repair endonuclease XPF-like [Penaeus monodon]|uniref:LOW QUALITY PROTEIN: DNA repair endonuclease XPF-like n=1 Tax=Penaeus monodon TaxID=6687 RepID=UPI0018A6F455|nr:LOW QUALITY PROTEIN: DNA repair endonuclease XPF-like [Penaeus monodon]